MSACAFLAGKVVLHPGDCLASVKAMPDASVDAVVTDPPYALVSIAKRFGRPGAKNNSSDAYQRAAAGFMGKQWDTGEVAFAVEFWAEILRVLKPGGHVVAFSGTRTYHRLACAIEDAGFEIRDQLAWAYGTGFPKSLDVSKAIDKHLGCERTKVRIAASRLGNPPNLVGGAVKGDDRPWRQEALARGYHEAASDEAASDEAASDEAASWQGWGTALKPAWEPIVLARKPLAGTVAANVLAHGSGALNVDGCRVGDEVREAAFTSLAPCKGNRLGDADTAAAPRGTQGAAKTYVGRHPANIVHDGSDEVLAAFAAFTGDLEIDLNPARFFYSAKADGEDRIGSKHPTVKPVDLMRWLCRLITPPGGLVLDPFAGTGTTGEAAFLEGFRAVLCEREEEYQADIARRMALVLAGPAEKAREITKARGDVADDHGPLFGGLDALGPRGGAGRFTAISPIKTNDWPDRAQGMRGEA